MGGRDGGRDGSLPDNRDLFSLFEKVKGFSKIFNLNYSGKQ